METNLTPIAVSTAHPLRFPDHPIAGQAGTSFKHEHLAAIMAHGKPKGSFEVHTVPDGWPVHITWAAMAFAIMAWGPGRISIDYAIRRLLGLPTTVR